MNFTPEVPLDVRRCPLCGLPNDCQLCMTGGDRAFCWCFREVFPRELIAQIPLGAQGKAYLCRNCVTHFQRTKGAGRTTAGPAPGEFYMDGGLMVFTAAFHLRRGYCCNSGCRHCPYPKTQSHPE